MMPQITQKLLTWHDQFGRHDLPWQNTTNAYRIWVSEIMLQQTQVATVIPYFERFMQQFPTVIDLANAEQDQVLHLWTGLGYYARARNLHKAAQTIRDDFDGEFPTNFDDVLSLTGIGRSTAGAVLAFSQNQRHPILDGNVKRVLSRIYEVEGWYGKKAVSDQLWKLAEYNTPKERVAQYTQAIMDFGATLCTRSKPNCEQCTFTDICLAYANDRVTELPHGKPKKAKPTKHTYILLAENPNNELLLIKNPPTGIWGGLWCPPQVSELKSQHLIANHEIQVKSELPSFTHTFSHYHLQITPVVCEVTDSQQRVAEAEIMWYNAQHKQQVGLAAPIKKLLENY